jgi:hypothetical protein
MPVFQYQDYRNPYGPSIAEALQRQADPQAGAALRAGDIAAQAAQQRGALRAQQFGELGAIPGAIQAQQAAAQQLALRQQQAALQGQQLQIGGLQLDEAKREQRSRQIFEAESQNPAHLNPDGTINEDKFLAALRGQDVGAWQKAVALRQANQKATLDWREGLAKIDASNATADDKRAAALKLRQDYLGTQALAAYTGLQEKPDDPLHARDWALGLAAKAVADQAVSPGVANQWIRQLAGVNPDQVGAALLSAVPPEMKAKYDKEQAEAHKPITVPAGDTVISPPNPAAPTAPPTVYYTAPPKDTTKPGTAEDWVARDRRLAVAQNGGVPLTDDQQRAVDARSLQAFKITNQDPEVREAALANKNLATLVAQMKYDQRVTPEMIQSTAEDLANHRTSPSQVFSLLSSRGAEGMSARLAVIAAAKKFDPTFNAEEAEANYQLVKSPAFQNTVRYMDSVQESIPRLLKNASALGRGPITSLNQLANMAASQFNDAQFARLKTDAVLVGDEVAKLLAGGGSGSATSDAKMKQGLELINTAASVPALAAALEEVDALVGFRRKALTRGTYLEGTRAGQAGAGTAGGALPAPTKGETRTANGETRVWDGTRWQLVK